MPLDSLDVYRTLDIAVDLANDYIEPVTLSCGDNEGRVLRVALTNGGATVDGSGLTARLLYNPRPQCSDSAGGYVTMTAVDGAETATWTACIPGDTLVPGLARLAVQVSSGDSVICTRGFDGLVESGIINEGASEAKSALSEFWDAVSKLGEEEAAGEEALKQAQEALSTAKDAAERATAAEATVEQAVTEATQAVADANAAVDAANEAVDAANSAADTANATNEAVAAAEAERADEWASMSLTIGDVITGQEGSDAYAIIRSDGSRLELKLDLTIPRGDTGTSVTILGEYDTLADLEVAHPTGELGVGYLLANGDLCVWNGTEWQDVGNIRGPVGLTPDITFTASVDEAKCTEAGMPSVDVTQTGTDESPNVALAFHGLVGADGEGFVWNILRGTNSGAALKSTSSWDAGTWRKGGTGTATLIDVSDAPVADIAYGWHIEYGSSGGAYIRQDGVPVVAGQTYVMSMYARGGYSVQFNYNDGSNHWSTVSYDINNDEWQQFSAVITPSTTGTAMMYYQIGSTEYTANADICGMKLELAQLADNPQPSAWTPSAWDITPQLSMDVSVDDSTGTPACMVTQETSGNSTQFDLAFSGLKGEPGEDCTEDVEYNLEATAYTYPGRDLTSVFADEIAGYSDAWAWLQARAKAANFTGLRIADYIPITLSTNENVNYCIGAIDPYYNCGDTGHNKGHHIVMVPNKSIQNCEGTHSTGSGSVQWNTTNNSNGTEDEPHPYLCSNLHAWELSDYYYQLPEKVRDVIMDNEMYLEERYSASGTLTDPTTGSWADMGPVWSPSEVEVYGCTARSYPYYSVGVCCQFPYFAMSAARVRNNRYNTWLRDPRSGTSASACTVNTNGYANSHNTSLECRARPCFLVG